MNDKQHEALLITQEECAEVTQAISKCFRFGLNNNKPGKSLTNKEHLEVEIGDLLAMIEILEKQGIITVDGVLEAKDRKISKLKIWSNLDV
jgi:NTP pyrophosphatase (non-canonical NTP hydrolase)